MKFGVQIDTQRIPVKGFVAEGGTAFPTTPVEGQHFHRTDLKQYFIYLNGGWQQSDNQGVAAAVHLHAIADVTGLQAALDAKAAASHTHTTAQVTGLDTALAGKAPTSHTHTKSQITDLANASDTVPGLVELATTAEATTGTDTVRAVTPAGVKAAINALVNAAPGTLDTLAELATALGNDPNFATTITTALAGKASTSHNHDLAFLSGNLPVTSGGTGATTAAGARAALSAAAVYSGGLPALTAGTWVTVTHGLNLPSGRAPVVSFYEAIAGDAIVFDWRRSSANAIEVRSDVAASANDYSVTIVG